jgi:hypothetical protein
VRRVGLVLVTWFAAWSSACGGASARGPSLAGPEILRVVPADTPYIYVALEPFARAYLERFMRRQRPRLHTSVEMLGRSGLDAPGAKLLLALVRELDAYYSPEGLERLGMGRGAWAFYGIGVVPALRIELAAPEKMAAFLDGVVAKSGVAVARETLGEHHYSVLRHASVALVWSVDRGALVATLAPASMLGEILPLLYGDRLPAKSLADTNAIPAMARAYGFAPLQVFYLDLQRLLGVLVDPRQDFDRRVLAAVGIELPGVDAACRSELTALAAEAPRMVAGAEELSPAHDRYRVTLELAPRTAKLLGALRGPAAGVGAPLGTALARFGVAADVRKAVDLAKLWTFAVKATPYRCSYLHGLNRLAGDFGRELDSPLPIWMEPLRGASVVIYDADLTQLRGYAMVTAADPLQVVGTLTALVPSLRGVTLPPDGTPVALPAGLGPIDHVAVKGNVIGVSAGGVEADLRKAIAAPVAPNPPLLQIAFDADRVRQAFGSLANDMIDMSGRWDFDLYVDERGLTLRLEELH